MSKELFSYLDDLLMLQSGAADRHNHKGVLGAVREDFLRQMLKDRVDQINVHTGEVTSRDGDLGQHDIIIRSSSALNTELGGNVRLAANDCSAVIEVKSNAKGTEITRFDQKSSQIKADSDDTVCGIVCYKLDCKKETILSRLGFNFDKDTDAFVKEEETDPVYSHLDFILYLNTDRSDSVDSYDTGFFVKRGDDGYDLFLEPPFTKYFLLEIKRAWDA